VSRGGLAALDYVHAYARKLLRQGGVLAPGGVTKMKTFDDALIARHLSPGGTADLLGLTWFLAQFSSEHPGRPNTTIRNDARSQTIAANEN
jgi:triphosphoribosyl-dephospho-CoA synthase